MKIVRLDTPESRKRASRGKLFQINVVPTLVVIWSNGELQLFAGQQKVGAWLSRLISKPRLPEPPEEDIEETEIVESYDPPESGLYSRKKRKSKKKHKKKRPKPSYKKVEEDSEDEEVEIEFVKPGKPEPPPTEGLLVGPQTSNKKKGSVSVFDVAKKMESERKNSLWYNEEDLPTPTY